MSPEMSSSSHWKMPRFWVEKCHKRRYDIWDMYKNNYLYQNTYRIYDILFEMFFSLNSLPKGAKSPSSSEQSASSFWRPLGWVPWQKCDRTANPRIRGSRPAGRSWSSPNNHLRFNPLMHGDAQDFCIAVYKIRILTMISFSHSIFLCQPGSNFDGDSG